MGSLRRIVGALRSALVPKAERTIQVSLDGNGVLVEMRATERDLHIRTPDIIR